MKVTTSRAFNPITITINTKEEADCLWHVLNSALFMDSEIAEYNMDLVSVHATRTSMWESLNEAHKPKEQ